MTNYQDVRTTEMEQGRGLRIAALKATQMIWLLLGFLEVMIALRVVFKLIAVNGANPFARLLFEVSDYFVAPFATLTGVFTFGDMLLELPSIIAMLVYLLIGWALVRIVYVLLGRPHGPVTLKRTVVSDHTPHQYS